MNRKMSLRVVANIVMAAIVGHGIARAQHFDVLAEQVNGQVVTGTADFDSNQWLLGPRLFHRDLGPGANGLSGNNPGFNALGAGSPSMPAGAQALPGDMDLSWDFLPMTISGDSRNLFYWNGQDTDGVAGITPDDVAFGPLPGPNYQLSLFDKANAKYSVNGANAVVPGGVIDTTAADGFIHRHRFFFLEDGDGNGATLPVDGIYLLAMRLRMSGLQNSLPVLMIFGTPGSSVAAEDDAAFPWVQQQLSLPGDYNQNGVVDTADYAVWRHARVTQAALPNETASPNVVDQADYDTWRQHFGQAAELLVGAGAGSMGNARAAGSGAGDTANATVPEPATLLILFAAAAGIRLRRRHIA